MSHSRQSIVKAINIKDYQLKKQDVFEIDGKTSAVLGAIQGHRSSLTDRMDVDVLTGFETLSVNDQKKVLKKVTELMQEHCPPKDGRDATVCAGVAWRSEDILHVATANLGDSEVYFVHVKPGVGVRVAQVNNKMCDNSLTPNIHVTQFVVPSNDSAYLLVSSKGLFEGLSTKNVKKVYLREAFDSQQNQNADRVIEHLVTEAYRRSRNNISAIVLPVKSTQAVSAAVFGDYTVKGVLNRLGRYFYELLNTLTATEVKARKQEVRVSNSCSKAAAEQASDILAKAIQMQASSPLSTLAQMRSSIATSTNKKQALIEHLPTLMKKASRLDILEIFDELEDINGEFSWIHLQRHQRFDRLRMFFGAHSQNPFEQSRWHTSTYQKAVKILKEAFMKAPELDDDTLNEQVSRFINYHRGNVPKLFSPKLTATAKTMVVVRPKCV